MDIQRKAAFRSAYDFLQRHLERLSLIDITDDQQTDEFCSVVFDDLQRNLAESPKDPFLREMLLTAFAELGRAIRDQMDAQQ